MTLLLNLLVLILIVFNGYLIYQDIQKNKLRNNWEVTLWLMIVPFASLWIVFHYLFFEGYNYDHENVQIWMIADLTILLLLGVVFKAFIRMLINLTRRNL